MNKSQLQTFLTCTREVPLPLVKQRVFLQTVRSSEQFTAQFTFVIRLACVDCHVKLQGAAFEVRFVANCASIPPLAWNNSIITINNQYLSQSYNLKNQIFTKLLINLNTVYGSI